MDKLSIVHMLGVREPACLQWWFKWWYDAQELSSAQPLSMGKAVSHPSRLFYIRQPPPQEGQGNTLSHIRQTYVRRTILFFSLKLQKPNFFDRHVEIWPRGSGTRRRTHRRHRLMTFLTRSAKSCPTNKKNPSGGRSEESGEKRGDIRPPSMACRQTPHFGFDAVGLNGGLPELDSYKRCSRSYIPGTRARSCAPTFHQLERGRLFQELIHVLNSTRSVSS